MQTIAGSARPEAAPSSPTLKDVARLAGVNVSTASRALAGGYGVKDKTRRKVLAIAQQLNYRPNSIARGLVTGKSRTIGMLVSDIRNLFFAEFARGAEDAAYAAGYDVVLCNSDLDPEKQWAYLRSLREKRVAGILMNSVSNFSEDQQDELARYGVPIVLLNRPAGAVQRFSTVSADNLIGGELAANYLIGLGHRIIAHLTGPRHHGNLTARCQGFLKACQSSTAKIKPIVLYGEQTYTGGYEMTNKLLSQHRDVTGIFAANDTMAFGVLRALQERGLSVPGDISLLGFDNLELSGIISPPLTTINQPKYELGRAAVEILLNQTNSETEWSPEHRLFGVNLVERKSCRAL
jgi:LacI family transcriptional regulator